MAWLLAEMSHVACEDKHRAELSPYAQLVCSVVAWLASLPHVSAIGDMGRSVTLEH